MARTRRLEWEALLNARDLGSLPTSSGHETRRGAVIRADSLASLSPAGRTAVVAYGVRTVIDLRQPFEVEAEPNPFAEPDHHGIAYHNLSFIDPASTPPGDRTTLADGYLGMLRRFGPQVAAIVTTVANAADGGVVVHCAAGKDRTGLVAALLLSIAGVAAEEIVDDYALSADFLRPREERWLEEGPGDRPEREAALRWSRARPEVMLEVLAGVDERYGGVEGYLLEAGVTLADLDRLRARMLAS